MKHKMIDLPYGYKDLEPVIDAKTMEIHYSKHYAGYVAGLNKAIEDTGKLGELELLDLLPKIKTLPESNQAAFKNNAGGACNHELYWNLLTPGGKISPGEELLSDIKETFGGLQQMISTMNDAGMKRFGSGWAWLVWNNGLEVCSTANQDSPLMGKEIAGCEGVPLIGIDVWEHAYYLKHQNKRADYLAGIWDVINWNKVDALYKAAKS
jgi:Fe-Mn family superoxide dismutase